MGGTVSGRAPGNLSAYVATLNFVVIDRVPTHGFSQELFRFDLSLPPVIRDEACSGGEIEVKLVCPWADKLCVLRWRLDNRRPKNVSTRDQHAVTCE